MSRRGLLIALLASLAINLFVLGGLVGAGMMGLLRPHGPPAMGPPPRLAALGVALSPAHREAWQTTIRQTVQGSFPKLRQAHMLRKQAWQGLATDPVNPQAALATLDQARALEFQARAEMDRAVLGFAATLPADERRKLSEALGRPHQVIGRHEWSGGGPGPGPGPGPGGGPGGEPPTPDR